MQVKCQQCGGEFSVIPARLATAKFCSVKCRSEWRKINFLGESNPKWKGGIRSKVCEHCGKTYHWEGEPHTTFLKRKFCSRECIVAGQKRYSGEMHPRYRPDARRRNRTGKRYVSWQTAVFSRDRNTCQQCGAQGVELHAHHIKPWEKFPELRFDVSNGITLCHSCHWAVHSAETENPVNSVNPLPANGHAAGNTEPSIGRKIVEGVTTRGRAYRRVELACEWCGVFVSKSVGRAKQAKHHFCSKQCSGKYKAAHRTWRPWNSPESPWQ
jgi:5-methylcytosine-specific restriction endonuclease McrA